MSWSLSQSGVVVDPVVLDKLTELVVKQAEASNPDGVDQVKLVVRIVEDILKSGVLGNTTKTYSVSISGHGNPAHEPKVGWSNDYISIRIAQE